MVIPFSNTKLRVPNGFQSLLVGLSTEVLRSQPRNIYSFAADYFERLVERRGQGEETQADKQKSQDDRYYNNRSFQEEYRINDPNVNNAATKIQAQVRGHQTRRDLQHKSEDEHHFDQQLSSSADEGPMSSQWNDKERNSPMISRRESPPPTYEEEDHHQRAETPDDDAQPNRFSQQHDEPGLSDRSKSPVHHTARSLEQFDSDRHDQHEQIDLGENDDIDQNEFSQRSRHFSEEDQRSPSFQQQDDEQDENNNNDDGDDNDDEMNRSNLDQAATRIQASYRGYKTRKELGSGSSHSAHHHHSTSKSPQLHSDYDSARSKNILSSSVHDNKEPGHEYDDNTAAIKIQAAYRGYRVRRNLEK